MTARRSKVKGRSEGGSFILLPHALLNHPKFTGLTPSAVKLLLDIFAQFRGFNNGDFSIAWKLMEVRGWNSKGTLYRARKELLNAGFISLTRQGGRNKCNLYAVTWLAIDECRGKLDVNPTSVASGEWKTPSPKTVPK